ncbi:hypothetical protein ACIOJE_40620 [Kitasatospora sp. NPDC087861]|uniref:hypothetical protein n=1 Tax=Kitasatospora sp. NPDC087861 TaxID=3364070 RepID=UPI0038009345
MVSQQHVLDPSRVAPGRAALWVQLQEVPSAPSSDAAGELDLSAGWGDERLVAGCVERMLGRTEAHAPGLCALVTR